MIGGRAITALESKLNYLKSIKSKLKNKNNFLFVIRPVIGYQLSGEC